MSRDSSPPLPVDMADPPSSPPLLPQTYTKKRARSSSLDRPGSSSDRFIFSSDDGPDDVANYNSPNRKKRQYTGTWWAHEHRPASSRTKAKAELSRNVDSGVWLPSDSSDDSVMERLAAAGPGPPLFGQVPREKQAEDQQSAATRPIRAVNHPSTEHAVAHAKVQECLEDGNERVDLSALQLRSVSDDLLLPLNHLIRHPKIGPEVPSEEAYEAFTPSLQVYLSSNLLRGLPGGIWHLQNLTVLSLRNNKLSELSPAIANLVNLKELNLSGNRLRWLPWELLQLVAPHGNLTRLTISPNPFVRGVRVEGNVHIPEDIPQMQQTLDELSAALDDPELAELREQTAWSLKLHQALLQKMHAQSRRDGYSHLSGQIVTSLSPFNPRPWKQEPIFIASTPVARMDFDGSLERGSPGRPSNTAFDVAEFPTSVDHVPADDIPSSNSRVPSLLELALRSASRISQPELLRDLLPLDTPDPVLRALDETVKAQQDGGQRCSVCKKEYVLPRAEWIEFWHYVPDSLVCSAEEAYLPFLRRACSLGCAGSVRGGEL